MKALRYVLLPFAFSLIAVGSRAQATVPTVNQAIGTQTLAAEGAPVSFDLRNVFTLPGVTGTVVHFDTVLGKFNVELLASGAPRHVANFLEYVRAGAYSNTLIHRSASLDGGQVSIVQGGGRRGPITNGDLPAIPKFAPVALEYNLPNERGSLAAARTADVNSATSEWYFNIRDNSAVLGPSNGGGYSVFGRVLGTGMSVVDAIAALPRVNAGGIFAELPVRNFPGGTIFDEHLVTFPSITEMPVFPPTNDAVSVIGLTVNSTNTNVATVALAGSTLAVTPRAAGSANITVRATDTNGNSVENTFAVNVAAGPAFTVQPNSQSVTAGGSVVLNAGATGATSYQWTRNGVNISGATNSTYTITNVQPEHAGVYVALAGNGSVTSASRPAVVGVTSTERVVGAATQVGSDIVHPSGLIYDQILLQGGAATVKADAGQVLRISYLDRSDDIVQVEFSGAGNLTLTVEDPSAPALPTKYVQDVRYVKGHASIVLVGADATTNLTVFSVGRGNAVNQALFRDDVTYDGMADIASIAIASVDGKFAGLRSANTRFAAVRGYTGIFAPGVQVDGPVFIGDISASETATSTISLAGALDGRLTGGDLFQENARAVQIDGLTRLAMTPGTDSHARQQAAQTNRGRLERNGVDVTSEVIVPAN